METAIIRITSEFMCCAVVVELRSDGYWFVIEAAPVVHYMHGWCTGKLIWYAKKRGWKTQAIEVDNDNEANQ